MEDGLLLSRPVPRFGARFTPSATGVDLKAKLRVGSRAGSGASPEDSLSFHRSFRLRRAAVYRYGPSSVPVQSHGHLRPGERMTCRRLACERHGIEGWPRLCRILPHPYTSSGYPSVNIAAVRLCNQSRRHPIITRRPISAPILSQFLSLPDSRRRTTPSPKLT